MSETRWLMRETDADLQLMADVLKINEITAQVMANRGLRTKNAALLFLYPCVSRLRDAMEIKDMSKAIERISTAIKNSEKILIYGDYDADGIMSTVILYKVLARLGANCEYYIPHRVDEGYGLNLAAVEKIASMGVDLLITVDNGISAIEEIAAAAARGIDTVIIDHHEPSEILPQAVAIVDPKQADCPFPFKELCAAGLTYKLAVTLCDKDNDELLVLAAIATLCDIVNLEDENRVLVTAGLAILNANKLINPGLGSLITARGYLDKPINAFTVGFVIGPCLNATGRLESAELAVALLLSQRNEIEQRIKLSKELTELNEARKSLTAECVERATASLPEELPKVLVLTDMAAHESVAGIVAGRIREITCRPTILFTRSEGEGMAKGSGRSVEEYNLFEALQKHRALFSRFGGHAMAAGLTLPEKNIDTLRVALNEECLLDDFRPILHIDRELSPDEITLALSNELTRLAPFGKGNHEPLFVTHALRAEKVRDINEKNTLIFTFVSDSGRRIKGIAFGLNERYRNFYENKIDDITLDVVYSIETNVWNNLSDVQIRIKDFRPTPRQRR
jgi:single-stranded-DNA-specific exonuclease